MTILLLFSPQTTVYLPSFNVRSEGCLHHVIFSEEIVFQALKNMKFSLSCDPDGLSSYFLKKLSFSLCKPLSQVFEFSFNFGCLPHQWKKAVVVPLHKKGDLSKTKNYKTCISVLLSVN